MSERVCTDRRTFLKSAATVAAAATVAGCEQAPRTGKRYGMVIDLQKCIGCNTCAVACKAENHTPPGVSYMVVLEEEIGEYPNVRRRFIPRPCMQCEKPSCTMVCPTAATYTRDDGVTVIDYDKCIGCRYCITACPYGARSFDFGHDYATACAHPAEKAAGEVVASLQPNAYARTASPEYAEYRPREDHRSPINNVRKCHFCLHRVERGMLPACASACPGRAIYFGDLNDPDSLVFRVRDPDAPEQVTFPNFPNRNVMQLKPEVGNDPQVYYLT